MEINAQLANHALDGEGFKKGLRAAALRSRSGIRIVTFAHHGAAL